jgi:hypothetical protein
MNAGIATQATHLTREETKLGEWRTIKRTLTRTVSSLVVKQGFWEKHAWLQATLVFGLFLCSAGAGVNWYEWAGGRAPVYVPLLWSLPVVGIFAVVPRRRVLIFAVLGLYVIYGVKAMFLDREPRAGYIVGAAMILLLVLLITTPSDWDSK